MSFLARIKKIGQNNIIIIKNILGAFFIKGLALIISVLTTPAFIDYFNNDYVLGIWYTVLAVLTWFLNFDLGIGNGIRNNLVKNLTAEDYESARFTISSGMFSSMGVAVALSIIGIVIIYNSNLYSIFNISDTFISYNVLQNSILLIFIAIMLRFLLTTITSIFYALQKSAINNLLTLCTSVLQLLFVLCFKFDDVETALIALSISYVVISNLPILVAGIIVFATKLKNCIPSIRYVKKSHIKTVTGIGVVFFACQIFYMLIVNTNEFLITNLFGPQKTTEYTYYYKLTSIISIITSLALTPIWSVVTKAMEEKNYVWVKKLYCKIKILGMLAIFFQFIIILFLQPIMDLWLGKGVISVENSSAIAFAMFGSVFIYSGALSTIVCGMSRMRLQALFYGFGAVFKFIFIYLLANVFDNWIIVVWSNVFVLLPYCIVQQIDLDIYLNKLIKN